MLYMSRLLPRLPLLAALSLLAPQMATAMQPDAPEGKITIIYERGADEGYDMIAKSLEEGQFFEGLAAGVHETVRIPQDITAVFRNCDVPNASYSPTKREITMCYELLAMFGQSAMLRSQDEQEIGEMMIGAAIFFFLHELGHAMVHQLELPVVGGQESAVDELAALMVLSGDEDQKGALMLADTVDQLGDMAAQKADLGDLRYWAEHPLDAQRMYNVLCMIYGSNPEAYAGLVSDDMLPQQRAQRCPNEYQQQVNSWNRLLGDNLK